jgi:hypothetical protein
VKSRLRNSLRNGSAGAETPALLVIVLRLLIAAHFQWSNPVYQAIENRSLWHLGFWEWIGSMAVLLFLLGAAVFLPENGCDETRT